MVNFDIKGTCEFVSKEEVRAMLHAAATVLEYHKWTSEHPVVTVYLTNDKRRLGKAPKSKSKDKDAWGRANWRDGWVMVKRDLDFDSTFTVVIHEVIHIYGKFDYDETECITSTLTDRLKPFIFDIYKTLIKDVYKRAAYIAHCKIAYKPEDEDHYNREQWDKEIDDKHVGLKYRIKRAKVEKRRQKGDAAPPLSA